MNIPISRWYGSQNISVWSKDNEKIIENRLNVILLNQCSCNLLAKPTNVYFYQNIPSLTVTVTSYPLCGCCHSEKSTEFVKCLFSETMATAAESDFNASAWTRPCTSATCRPPTEWRAPTAPLRWCSSPWPPPPSASSPSRPTATSGPSTTTSLWAWRRRTCTRCTCCRAAGWPRGEQRLRPQPAAPRFGSFPVRDATRHAAPAGWPCWLAPPGCWPSFPVLLWRWKDSSSGSTFLWPRRDLRSGLRFVLTLNDAQWGLFYVPVASAEANKRPLLWSEEKCVSCFVV